MLYPCLSVLALSLLALMPVPLLLLLPLLFGLSL
jgi:hypothetical protein